jgi:hypothetical protein
MAPFAQPQECRQCADERLDARRGSPARGGRRGAQEVRHPVALARLASALVGEIGSSQLNLPKGTPLTAENLARREHARELTLEALRSRDAAELGAKLDAGKWDELGFSD